MVEGKHDKLTELKKAINEIKAAQAAQEAQTAMKLPDSEYITVDISDEEWREVKTSEGLFIHIADPQTLIMRRGGKTHRVVDAQGVVYCYVAPETGKSVITWKARSGKIPVRF